MFSGAVNISRCLRQWNSSIFSRTLCCDLHCCIGDSSISIGPKPGHRLMGRFRYKDSHVMARKILLDDYSLKPPDLGMLCNDLIEG